MGEASEGAVQAPSEESHAAMAASYCAVRRNASCASRWRGAVVRGDAGPVRRGEVLGQGGAREKAAVNFGMQLLPPPTHHLGEAGPLRHVPHRQTRLAQQLRGAARREDLDAEAGERPREL